jgi:hypothetical protein
MYDTVLLAQSGGTNLLTQMYGTNLLGKNLKMYGKFIRIIYGIYLLV